MRKIIMAIAVLMLFAGSLSAASWDKYIYNKLNDGIVVTDNRYDGKVSTHTANKVISSGIIIASFTVTNISFLSKGGIAEVTGFGGTMYIPDNSALSQSFEIGFDTPTITVTLPASTTLYYTISGVR